MTLVLPTLISLVIAQGVSEAKGPNHPWSGCGPGSWVRWDVRQSDGMRELDRWEEKKEVLSADAQRVKLKLSHFIRDGKAAQVEERTLELPSSRFVPFPDMKRLVDETLLISGQKVSCEVWAGGSSKAWVAKDASRLPRALVKLEKDGEETERESIVALGEKVKVGGREVSCVVVEHKSAGKDYTIEMKTWWSVEVPGFLVKEFSTSVFNKTASQTQQSTMVDFERKR